MSEKRKIGFIAGVLVVFALSRWPGLMPPNFSMAYALVFCAGALGRRLPWLPVLGVLLVSDVVKNVWVYETSPFSDYMAANYLAYGLIFLLGRLLPCGSSTLRLAGGGLVSALVFYVVTNTAAWIYDPEYSKTLAGWVQSLTIGTSGWPETWKFFRNTLLSGGLFSGALGALFLASQPTEPEPEPESESQPAEEPAPTDSPETGR